jgi:uncharacterized protein (DUF885 family)
MLTRRTALATAAAALAAPARAADYETAFAQAFGSEDANPFSAHALAVTEAHYAQARADVLLLGQGLTEGSVAERLRTLAQDPRWLFSDDEAGRDAAVAQMNDRLAKLRPRLTAAFGDLALPQAQVRRPAPADEARGGYREPPVYYVDLRNIRARPAWTLPSVAFHETRPGHALQAAVAGKPRPASFSEAWATYAERLACDLGAYAGDPLGELGFLHWRLFRLGRVIADTGLGTLDWSLDEAVAAMRDLQGFDAAFVTIEADAARMRAQPGVYAAQGLGAILIGLARPRRRSAWPAFHRAILADGPWPSVMLPAP